MAGLYEKFRNKIFYVVGLGKSGLSVASALTCNNIHVKLWDDNENVRKAICTKNQKLCRVSTFLCPETIRSTDEFDILVLTPGIPHTYPTPHMAAKVAQMFQKPIWCDVELFFQLLEEIPAENRPRIVGITGTNGKSTTTALTHHVLQCLGCTSAIGGNFGIPVFDLDVDFSTENYQMQKPPQVLVLELSSFQLELMSTKILDASIILNITADHLERHGGLSGYIEAKENIFHITKDNGNKILIIDDKITLKIAQKNIQNLVTILFFHKQENDQKSPNETTFSLTNSGQLMFSTQSRQNSLELSQLTNLPGKHNWLNIAGAYALIWSLFPNITFDKSRFFVFVTAFTPLAHRQEIVGRKEGVFFVDDSKATNFHSTVQALRAFDNILLILGGRSKCSRVPVAELKPFFVKILGCFLIGECSKCYLKDLTPHLKNAELCETLQFAFLRATETAKKLQLETDDLQQQEITVLLSPACSSLDQYDNFEQRGDHFKSLVEAHCNL